LNCRVACCLPYAAKCISCLLSRQQRTLPSTGLNA